MRAKRKDEVIVETLEKITIRVRNRSQRRYCSSCGKPATWLSADEARSAARSAVDQVDQKVAEQLSEVDQSSDGSCRTETVRWSSSTRRRSLTHRTTTD
jgi:hypothetical protein